MKRALTAGIIVARFVCRTRMYASEHGENDIVLLFVSCDREHQKQRHTPTAMLFRKSVSEIDADLAHNRVSLV